eukprot:6465989-Amphidinium_carterae.1
MVVWWETNTRVVVVAVAVAVFAPWICALVASFDVVSDTACSSQQVVDSSAAVLVDSLISGNATRVNLTVNGQQAVAERS